MAHLKDIIKKAQAIKYRKPNKKNSELLDNEVVNYSIYKFINDDIFVRSCSVLCNRFPPLTFIIRAILNNYINSNSKN
jgi:hypothetical protein